MTSVLSTDTLLAGARWRRLSPRMLLVHPVIEVGRAVPALVGLFFAGSSSGGGSVWSLAATAAVIAYSLTRWFTTSFRIAEDQIQLRRGLLRRTTISARLDRVRTVDVTAHLLHRSLGLAKVAIGTGTSDRKGRGGLVLDGLSAAAAANLRGELLHRGTPPPARPTPAVGLEAAASVGGEEQLARLNPSWIRYAPFTLSGAITSLAVIGFGWRLDTEAHVNLTRVRPLRSIGTDARHASLALDVVATVVLVAVLVSVASIIGYALAFWGLRLTRHDGGSLHVTRGLVTSRATSIERTRLVGVEISEPLLLRMVGGSRCSAIATGLRVGRGADRGGEVLLPPAPRAVVADVVRAVLGSQIAGSAGLGRHPSSALRRRILRTSAAAVLITCGDGVLVTLTGLTTYTWYLCLALVVLSVPLGVDRYRSLGHAIIDGYVVAQLGSLIRRRSVIRTDDVIGWNLSSSFFQRRAGLTTLVATTAAGKQGYAIVDISDVDAVAFAESATAGLLVQFVA